MSIKKIALAGTIIFFLMNALCIAANININNTTFEALEELPIFDIHAKIDSINTDRGHINIVEKTIEAAMQTSSNPDIFRTKIQDWNGNDISIKQFKAGDSVFLRAWELPDDRFLARDIYLLPKNAGNIMTLPFFIEILKE
jgi:hypothetical protein